MESPADSVPGERLCLALSCPHSPWFAAPGQRARGSLENSSLMNSVCPDPCPPTKPSFVIVGNPKARRALKEWQESSWKGVLGQGDDRRASLK